VKEKQKRVGNECQVKNICMLQGKKPPEIELGDLSSLEVKVIFLFYRNFL